MDEAENLRGQVRMICTGAFTDVGKDEGREQLRRERNQECVLGMFEANGVSKQRH